MKRKLEQLDWLVLALLLVICLWALTAHAQSPLLAAGQHPVAGGIAVTLVGSTPYFAASGHTFTISSVTLATGDSVMVGTSTPALNGTITATWNGVSCTEDSTGGGTGTVEGHYFYCNNVTGATGNVVFTKTDAGDDSKAIVGVAVRISGLTSHTTDQIAILNSSSGDTSWGVEAVTTTVANTGLVAMISAGGNSTITFGTWNSSFTSLVNTGNASGTCCVMSVAGRVVSATGTYQPASTGNTSEPYVSAFIAFK